jgi:hypothetical protein
MRTIRAALLAPFLFSFLMVMQTFATPAANFKQAVFYATGGTVANAVAVADVNGDNKPDLIVANQCVDTNCASGTIAVLLGVGDGTFQPPTVYPSGGAGAVAVVTADVNHDNKPDLVVANACVTNGDCTDGTLAVLLGSGNGTFQPAVTYSTGTSVYGLALADVNQDTKFDAVVGTTAGVGALLGNNDGTFQPVLVSQPVGYGALAVGDLDGDGIPDAVVLNSSGSLFHPRENGSIAVVFGNGNGTFTAPLVLDSLAFLPDALAIVDFNRNGIPDILVSNYVGRINANSGSVGLWYGAGNQTFGPGVETRVGGIHAYAVAAGDVNGDGIPDMVVSERGNVSVVLTNGETRHHGVSLPKGIAIADLDGDGQPDIAVASTCSFNCSGAGVAVLISTADPTKTTVTTSGSPSQLNQPVTFTATITSDRGAIADGKIITFFDGTKQIGTGTTSQGAATFTTSSLTAGSHTIKAKFPGYPFFKSSSGTVKQVVNP